MNSKTQFSENLKFLRNQQTWSQSYLSNKLDISVGTYSSYERGLSEPPLSVLIKLSEVFNVSIDYLARGKEFVVPLTQEETSVRHMERMALRLENRVERQTQLLNHIGRKIESDLASIVKSYGDDYIDIFSRTAGTVLLEEEIWSIEQCSGKTRVACPYVEDNINVDPETGEYSVGDYFHNLETNLRENPDHEYIEIYADNVETIKLEKYKRLIRERCGNAALKRVEVWKSNHPIITQYAIYEVKLTTLRDKHPSIFEIVADHVVDGCFIALLITPQLSFTGINLLADKKHCEYIINHFNYLIKQSSTIQ